MNKIFTSIIILLYLFFVKTLMFGQNDSVKNKVPHQLSVEFGNRYSFYRQTSLTNLGQYQNALNPQIINLATHGIGFLFDYGWQLSGFNGYKPAVYLTVPMGYTILFSDNSTSKRIGMLNYGWTIRHELVANKNRIIPFVGYGLFLNRLSVAGIDGSVMGHQTQFEGGLNFKTLHRLIYFVKLQTSYSSYPRLDYNKSLHFMYADIRVGVRM